MTNDRGDLRDRKNDMAVVASCQQHSGAKTVKAIVKVLDGQGYVQFDSGIAAPGTPIPLPKGKFDLWAHMTSLLDSRDTPAKQ